MKLTLVVLNLFKKCKTLQWRHNGRDDVSNHQSHNCLLNRLFRRRAKKTSKLRVTGLCAGNSPVTSEFPVQRAGDAENFSIWWRLHEYTHLPFYHISTYHRYMEFFLVDVKNLSILSILHSQHHGYWWLGHTKIQGINSIVLTQNISFSAPEGLDHVIFPRYVTSFGILFWHICSHVTQTKALTVAFIHIPRNLLTI